MTPLRIPVSDIKDEGLRLDTALDVEALRPEGAAGLPVKEASIKGILTAMGDEVLFRGTIRGTFEQACDRCLEPLVLPFEVDCTWYFEPGGENDDDEDDVVYRLDGEDVDLAGYVWEEMALAFPSKFVCPEDRPCAFRDQFRAQAVEEEIPTDETNPFLKLKNMFPGEPGEQGKE